MKNLSKSITVKTFNENIFKYLLIILLIYMSGNVFFRNFNYTSSVILVFLYSLMLFIYSKRKKLSFDLHSVILLLTFSVLMSFTILFNQTGNYTTYIAIFIQMLTAMLATEIVTIKSFKNIYIKIIIFLSATSLVFHLIGLLYPNIVLLFPKTDALVSANYHNAIIHVYQTLTGYGQFVFHSRNAGIFWEPGAFQAFVNIGLIFLLESVKEEDFKEQKVKISIAILITTIISTYSTTGFLILFLIIITNIKKIMKIFSYRQPKDFLIMTIVLGTTVFFTLNEIQSALVSITNKYLDGSQSWAERISLDKISILFSNVKTFLIGETFYTNAVDTSKIWNSIIQTSFVFGIPFTMILLHEYLKASYRFSNKGLLFFIILLIIFSTENLIWRPFFLFFIFSKKSTNLHL